MQEQQTAAAGGEAQPATGLRRQVRVAQTLDEIERLQAEVDAWKKRRDAADIRRRFVTQLSALHKVVARALCDLRTDTLAIGSDPDIGSVYQRCSLQDKRVLWVRRVLWGFYREKFDQRDGDDQVRSLLNAADDVVWSCYEEPFRNLPKDRVPGPIPLAYVEPFYSPQALPRDEVPGTLKDKRLGDQFLKQYFTKLPIPLVSLPPVSVASPWWLVYLSHEVGHHVQHDLDLVRPFEDLLGARAGTERWAEWGQEIFADAFALHMMGGSVVHAIAELVTSPERDMMIAQESYPSPAVRLALLTRAAGRLHLDIDAAAIEGIATRLLAGSPDDDLGKELHAELQADLAIVGAVAAAVVPAASGVLSDAVAAAARGPIGSPAEVEGSAAPVAVGALPGFRALAGWNDADFRPAGAVETWTKALAKNTKGPPERHLSAARHIVSAGMQVWRKIAALDKDADRAAAMAKLRPRMLEAIDRTRDETTRAADRTSVVPVGALAAEISEGLRHAELFEW